MAHPAEDVLIDGVLFDLDDTLIDTAAAMHLAGAAAAAVVWPDADPQRLAIAGVRFRSDPGGFFGAYTRGELTFAAMRAARIADLGAWLGAADVQVARAAFDAAYEPAFVAALQTFKDAPACLKALQDNGIRIGLLTNSGADYTAAKLRHTSLAGVTDVVCTRDTLGFGKPDARAFHEACRQLGTDPARTLHIGDELHADPLGAADAGLRAAWLVRDGALDEGVRAEVTGRGIAVIDSLDVVRPGWLGLRVP